MAIEIPFPMDSGYARVVALTMILILLLPLLFLIAASVTTDVSVRIALVVASVFAPPISFLTVLAFDIAKRTSNKKAVVPELAQLITAITILVLIAILIYIGTLHIYQEMLENPR